MLPLCPPAPPALRSSQPFAPPRACVLRQCCLFVHAHSPHLAPRPNLNRYLWRRLKSLGVDVDKAKAEMRDVIVKSLVCCMDAIPNQTNCFELFGYDILFDSKMRPWLVEVNLSPSMARENKLAHRLPFRALTATHYPPARRSFSMPTTQFRCTTYATCDSSRGLN